MATLTELAGLLNEPVLAAKCMAACLVAARAVEIEAPATTNHANRLKWAKSVYEGPAAWGVRVLRAVLAANAAATLAAINAASDATIQTAVNAAVDTFADGLGG